MSENINIAYSITSDRVFSALVSIQSIIENNKNNILNFYFVADSSLGQEDFKSFEYLKTYKNCTYQWVTIDNTIFRSMRSVLCNDLSLCYYFNLHNLIDIDRVLYLDTDTIINIDLAELFNMNLSGFSCAAPEYIYPDIVKKNIEINDDIIFNSTTLLMDLKKWRKNKYFEKFKSLPPFEKPLNGINCFNILVKDCKLIDYQYSYTETNPYWLNNAKLTCSANTQQIHKLFEMHVEMPSIVLFAGQPPLGSKECCNSYTSLWWKYAEQTPIYEEIKQFRQLNKYKLSNTTAQNSFKYKWLLSRILPYIKPYWFRILIGFMIAIPLGLLDGVTALALKPYMDYVVGNKEFAFSWHGMNVSVSSLQMAYIIPICVVLFAALQGVLRYLNGYCSTWTSQRITNDVKFDLFDRLIHMHPQFFDDNSSGIVISRYMSDPRTASAGIVDNIKTITTSIFGTLGLIAVMIYSSWKLALVGVLILCVAFIPVILIRKRIREASNKNMVIGGNITTNINETYSGNKVMSAYGLQKRQKDYFVEQTWKSFRINMSLYKRAGWMSPLMYLIASFGIAIVLGVGTYLIKSGQMTAGEFTSFATSLLLLYKPVKTLGNTLTGIQNIFVAMGRVFELFDLPPAIQDSENPKEFKEFKHGISFEHVNFEYVPNKPVLKDLSLDIRKNETLAIVGNSGGGKSTLVNLLPRFYDIKSGSIKFDGTEIKEFSLQSLRQNISMVFQDNFLFTGTIKENIMMGNPEASTEELMSAIKAARLQDVIQGLPDGLDTMLGERGLTLSGGQRQRVAIARAILRNAPIVILDEATSALDNESEAVVQKAMDNLMKNRTVFIIAHRLSTIKNADRIAVINEGELVELGTHEELMNIENGQYKALYEMQFKKQQDVELDAC